MEPDELGPVMEDEVFAGVIEGVDRRVCRVLLEADQGRALLPGTSWTCPGSFSAPRKGLNGPRYTLNGPRSIYDPRTSSGFVTFWGLDHPLSLPLRPLLRPVLVDFLSVRKNAVVVAFGASSAGLRLPRCR